MDALPLAISAYLLLIAGLTFIHEYGHYLAARLCGLVPDRFSIGFGPALLSWRDQHGTSWRVSLLLVGGYVGLADPRTGRRLDDLSRLRQTAVIAAGPATNLLAAFLLFWTGLCLQGTNTTPARVLAVVPDGPAARAGVLPGDTIQAFANRPVRTTTDLAILLYTHGEGTTTARLARPGPEGTTTHEVRINVETQESRTPDGGRISGGWIGVTLPPARYEIPDPLTAVDAAIRLLARLTSAQTTALQQIASQTRSTEELAGPVRIATTAGDILNRGPVPFLFLAALASLSIALVNLLPIPGLDGGQLLRIAIEALLRRPIPPRLADALTGLGLACVFGFTLFLIAQDIAILANAPDGHPAP